MTLDEIIAVVTAYKEGKKIQFRYKAHSEKWVGITNPSWDFHKLEYRVQPPAIKYRLYFVMNHYTVSGVPKPEVRCAQPDDYVHVQALSNFIKWVGEEQEYFEE